MATLNPQSASWFHRVRRWLYTIACHDFFPALSSRVRRYFYNPLGILILAAVVSLLCGFFLQSQGYVLCGGVLSVIALGLVWPWLTIRGLTGTLSFEQSRASEGESVEVRLTLRNRLPWTGWGIAVHGGFDVDSGRALAGVASTPGRRTAVCRWRFSPSRRGIYPLIQPRLGSGFPFGLWEARRPLAVDSPLLVWPQTFPVGPVPPVRGDQQIEGNVSRNKVGTIGDVLGVRPYRRGDSPRRIHWGQSAKHNRLIVCELQSNARPVIQIVLDADPRIHVGQGVNSSREWAIRIVASLASGWLEQGAQVGLAWADFDIPPASGITQTHRILDALASLPDEAGKPLETVLACPRCRGFRDGLQVIVTTDRLHLHAHCQACVTNDQRWVVLRAVSFAETGDEGRPHCESDKHPRPWLLIDSRDNVPQLLRNGWREARHGS